MSIERKLSDWQAAGLIDAGTAEAIRAHEAAGARPVARWATVALGLLALALGLTLIVAANWDAIPRGVKLGANGALAVTAAVAAWRARSLWLREGALFLLGALVLGGLALQGQVYQLTGPVWMLLGWWAVLMTPAILALGATRFTAYGWALMLAFAATAYAADMPGLLLAADNLPAALPPALLLASLLPLGRAADDGFVAGLRESGLVSLLGGASLAQFAWGVAISGSDAREAILRLLLALVVAAVVFGRSGAAPLGIRGVLRASVAGAAGATVLALCVPHGDSFVPRFVGALSFLALWAWVGKAAHDAGWRALFNLAVGMVALRLFVVYLELFGSQAATGLGLIAGGLLLVGLALAWERLVKRWRPA